MRKCHSCFEELNQETASRTSPFGSLGLRLVFLCAFGHLCFVATPKRALVLSYTIKIKKPLLIFGGPKEITYYWVKMTHNFYIVLFTIDRGEVHDCEVGCGKRETGVEA
jgi:hypothetical protein